MWHRIIVILVALSFVACDKSDSKPEEKPVPAPEPKTVEPKPPEAVPPPPPAGNDEFVPVSGAGYSGYVAKAVGPSSWQPTDDDIAALEATTAKSLDAAKKAGEVPAQIDLTSYVRQYHGHLVDNHKVIGVQFICPDQADLAKSHFGAHGGYTCFVRANYDVESGTLVRWRVNSKR